MFNHLTWITFCLINIDFVLWNLIFFFWWHRFIGETCQSRCFPYCLMYLPFCQLLIQNYWCMHNSIDMCIGKTSYILCIEFIWRTLTVSAVTGEWFFMFKRRKSELARERGRERGEGKGGDKGGKKEGREMGGKERRNCIL